MQVIEKALLWPNRVEMVASIGKPFLSQLTLLFWQLILCSEVQLDVLSSQGMPTPIQTVINKEAQKRAPKPKMKRVKSTRSSCKAMLVSFLS